MLHARECREDDGGVRHVGPIAEDFHAAFGLGIDDKHITPADVGGVSLVAIQALDRMVAARDAELDRMIAARDARIAELTARLEALEAKLARMAE